ncbi:MAG TPA: hypothetical protein P5119_01430 [Candidatus Aminicenantes bacterium]|nr:hypothetical protein [Candidatus Aminicenantes bacterium]HRY63986.1 hypothetical protein [Candidatus Aminicenantes bacterium]HRZ70899.1 hypothetical protein [Candidatus Aminicenantes bacterium]
MDVFITPEAGKAIEALPVFQPEPGAWGVLLGHRRGPRVIVEGIALGGGAGRAPDAGTLAGFDRIWPGRVVGLAAVRPGAAFKRAVLGPAWYGKLVLTVSGRSPAWTVLPRVVEFERRFFLAPARLAPAGKEDPHE